MKRCPFKINLNKLYTYTFKDIDFCYYFGPNLNQNGTYSAVRSSPTPMFEWAVYDTLQGTYKHSDQIKDKIIDLVFDGVLQKTLSDNLYDEYNRIKTTTYTTKEEVFEISRDFSRRVSQHYSQTLFKTGLQKRKILILSVVDEVMSLHGYL